jgi:hypothetical protein
MDKHSSLLRTFVGDEEKKIYNPDTRAKFDTNKVSVEVRSECPAQDQIKDGGVACKNVEEKTVKLGICGKGVWKSGTWNLYPWPVL